MEINQDRLLEVAEQAIQAHEFKQLMSSNDGAWRDLHPCTHPPFKKDGTHDGRFGCRVCHDAYWKDMDLAQEHDITWRPVIDVLIYIGVLDFE